jgi:hypothetical protein
MTDNMTRHWIAVASAEHVRIGQAAGFMQVCHGKAAPLRRIRPGDKVVYYSPSSFFDKASARRDKLQSFTAIGIVREGEPYLAEMGGGFHPWRREVNWLEAMETPIKPLLAKLEFTAERSNWGHQMRFGLFTISPRDHATIAAAMGGGRDGK